MPPRAHNIKADEFNGALEVLLEMVQKRKMHISEISLAQVADDYVAYLRSLKDIEDVVAYDFMVIASTLLLIKSKSLLPNLDLTIEEEVSIKDLESRLELHKLYKSANTLLVERIKGSKPLYSPKTIKVEQYTFKTPINLSTAILKDSIVSLLAQLPESYIKPQARISKKINIKDVMMSLLARVESGSRQSLTSIAGSEKEQVLVNFLALLELIKDGLLFAKQDKAFGEIILDKEYDMIS